MLSRGHEDEESIFPTTRSLSGHISDERCRIECCGQGGNVTHPVTGLLSSVTSRGHLEVRVGTAAGLGIVDFGCLNLCDT
jgi:hypothetical protein